MVFKCDFVQGTFSGLYHRDRFLGVADGSIQTSDLGSLLFRNHQSGRAVGATIDFLAGEKSRAPIWMRKTGLEWLHRCISEPRRLAMRYAKDAWVFPQLFWDEWRGVKRRASV